MARAEALNSDRDNRARRRAVLNHRMDDFVARKDLLPVNAPDSGAAFEDRA